MRDDRPERRTSDCWAALWVVIFTATLAAHLCTLALAWAWWQWSSHSPRQDRPWLVGRLH